MTCRKCGELLSDNARFCTACGAAVERNNAEATIINPIHTHQEDCSHQEEYVHEGYVVNPGPVSFPEAVKRFFTHYADFSGRARRSEYWWVTLFNSIVGGLIGAILPEIAGLWTLVILVPTLALLCRRLHDVGKRGWFYL